MFNLALWYFLLILAGKYKFSSDWLQAAASLEKRKKPVFFSITWNLNYWALWSPLCKICNACLQLLSYWCCLVHCCGEVSHMKLPGTALHFPPVLTKKYLYDYCSIKQTIINCNLQQIGWDTVLTSTVNIEDMSPSKSYDLLPSSYKKGGKQMLCLEDPCVNISSWIYSIVTYIWCLWDVFSWPFLSQWCNKLIFYIIWFVFICEL